MLRLGRGDVGACRCALSGSGDEAGGKSSGTSWAGETVSWETAADESSSSERASPSSSIKKGSGVSASTNTVGGLVNIDSELEGTSSSTGGSWRGSLWWCPSDIVGVERPKSAVEGGSGGGGSIDRAPELMLARSMLWRSTSLTYLISQVLLLREEEGDEGTMVRAMSVVGEEGTRCWCVVCVTWWNTSSSFQSWRFSPLVSLLGSFFTELDDFGDGSVSPSAFSAFVLDFERDNLRMVVSLGLGGNNGP